MRPNFYRNGGIILSVVCNNIKNIIKLIWK